MGIVSLTFAAATAACVMFSFAGRKAAPDAVWMALVFAGWFCIFEALRPFAPRSAITAYDPAIDALLGTLSVIAWLQRPSGWRAALAGSFLIQSGIHVLFRSTHLSPHEAYQYQLAINIVHAFQLLMVSWEGVHDVGHWLRARLLPAPAVRRLHGAPRRAEKA
jgi:hypothetical protein